MILKEWWSNMAKPDLSSFSIGDIVRIDLVDKDFEPGQWLRAKVKAVVSDGFYLDIPDILVWWADGEYFYITPSCKVGCLGNFYVLTGGFLENTSLVSRFAGDYKIDVSLVGPG